MEIGTEIRVIGKVARHQNEQFGMMSARDDSIEPAKEMTFQLHHYDENVHRVKHHAWLLRVRNQLIGFMPFREHKKHNRSFAHLK